MFPLLANIQTTTYELTPISSRPSSFLWTSLSLVNKVHALWRWYRRIELYRNPENLSHLLAGRAVHFVLGDVMAVRIAAQCLLIATRLLECVQEQEMLLLSIKRWVLAVQGHYPHPVSSCWKSSSAFIEWKLKGILLKNKLLRILDCTKKVLLKIFTLSMRLLDVMDAFCLSPYSQHDAINESFVNAMKWLKAIVSNREELLQGLVTHQTVIERILKHSPITYLQLYNSVEQTLKTTETVYNSVSTVSTISNGILIDLGKRALSGGFVIIGLSRYRPLFLA